MNPQITQDVSSLPGDHPAWRGILAAIDEHIEEVTVDATQAFRRDGSLMTAEHRNYCTGGLAYSRGLKARLLTYWKLAHKDEPET
jgi:hypothetical protein